LWSSEGWFILFCCYLFGGGGKGMERAFGRGVNDDELDGDAVVEFFI
jgi:hypothetical protein